MNPGAEQTAAIRGAGVRQAERPLGTLGLIALAITALVLAPLVAVVANAFGPGESTWAHLARTVLPAYLGNTLLLMLGVAYGVVSIGVPRRLARHRLSFPRPAHPRVGARPATRDARLRDGLCVHRLAAVHRPGADALARADRVAGTGVLVPGDPLALRCGGHALVRALSLRLPARAHELPRAVAERARGRAARRLRGVGQLLPRRGAACAARDRRRHRTCADGDARRLRRGVVLRGRDVHDRHLQGLARDGRRRGGVPARHLPARLRDTRARARALESRRRTLSPDRAPHAAAAAAAAGRCGSRRPRRLRRAGAVRVSPPGRDPAARRRHFDRGRARRKGVRTDREQRLRCRRYGSGRRRRRRADGLRGAARPPAARRARARARRRSATRSPAR